METQIKLNLNIVLPGRTLLSEQECSKNPKENYYHTGFQYETTDKTGKKRERKTIHLALRKGKPTSKSLNISKEAWLAMQDNQIPKDIKFKQWKKMTKDERLKANLDELVASLGGISYSYVVFDD